MITLAERRAWMREGCPLPEEPKPEDPCRSFTFRVWPQKGVMTTTCKECGDEYRAGGIKLGEYTEERDLGYDYMRKIEGGQRALQSLCAWADSHTKVENVQPTYEAIKGDNRWHDAAIWLRRLMNGQEATMYLAGAKVDERYRATLAADPIKELAE